LSITHAKFWVIKPLRGVKAVFTEGVGLKGSVLAFKHLGFQTLEKLELLFQALEYFDPTLPSIGKICAHPPSPRLWRDKSA